MKKKAWKFLFFLFAIVLIYVSIALVMTITARPVHFDNPQHLWFGIGGFMAGCYVFALLNRFNSVYVLGHEFTHWVLAKLFLKNTGRFQVGSSGGSVEIKDSNFLIVLAPYIFPFYFLLFAGIYCVVLLIWPSLPEWSAWGVDVWLGLCYAYHVVMTIIVLRKGQKDMNFRGLFFSLSFIIAGNLFFFYLGLVFLNGQFGSAMSLLWNKLSWVLLHWGWNPLSDIINHLCHFIGKKI